MGFQPKRRTISKMTVKRGSRTKFVQQDQSRAIPVWSRRLEGSRMSACKKNTKSKDDLTGLTTCKIVLWRVFSELLKGRGRGK